MCMCTVNQTLLYTLVVQYAYILLWTATAAAPDDGRVSFRTPRSRVRVGGALKYDPAWQSLPNKHDN